MNPGMDTVDEPALYISMKNFRWLYRGEGNANLVISLPQEQIILRMPKCEYDVNLTPHLVEDLDMKLKKDVKFYKKIMVPLLGKDFIQTPLLIRLRENEISALDDKLFAFRPKFRLSKGVRSCLVTAHPDYAFLPSILPYSSLINGSKCQILPLSNDYDTYCVEIKPKQGWVPYVDRQHPKCTFCMNQHLKYLKKRIGRFSHYCPLDLFSGIPTRMKRALRNLLVTPQNNLKIFKNGNIVYDEDSDCDYLNVLKSFLEPEEYFVNSERLLEKWAGLLAEALTQEVRGEAISNFLAPDDKIEELNGFKSSFTPPLSGLIIEPCDWAVGRLPEHCILNRILRIQKLQNTSFNSVYESYRKKNNTENDYDYVDKLLEPMKPLDIVQRYLLSASAKDCSIFVAMRRTNNEIDENSLNYVSDSEGKTYRVNIGVSDIGPKPLSCIERHYKRDREVSAAFLQLSKTANNYSP